MKYEPYRVAPNDWRIVSRFDHGAVVCGVVQHHGQDLRFTNMADAATWLYYNQCCYRPALMSDKAFERRRS